MPHQIRRNNQEVIFAYMRLILQPFRFFTAKRIIILYRVSQNNKRHMNAFSHIITNAWKGKMRSVTIIRHSIIYSNPSDELHVQLTVPNWWRWFPLTACVRDWSCTFLRLNFPAKNRFLWTHFEITPRLLFTLPEITDTIIFPFWIN